MKLKIGLCNGIQLLIACKYLRSFGCAERSIPNPQITDDAGKRIIVAAVAGAQSKIVIRRTIRPRLQQILIDKPDRLFNPVNKDL